MEILGNHYMRGRSRVAPSYSPTERFSMPKAAFNIISLIAGALGFVSVCDGAAALTYQYRLSVPGFRASGPATPAPQIAIGDGTSKAGACASGQVGACVPFSTSVQATLENGGFRAAYLYYAGQQGAYSAAVMTEGNKYYFETAGSGSGNPLVGVCDSSAGPDMTYLWFWSAHPYPDCVMGGQGSYIYRYTDTAATYIAAAPNLSAAPMGVEIDTLTKTIVFREMLRAV